MDKYAKAFADAMEEKGMRNTTVAAYLGSTISVGNVSHWRTGRRGIPKEHAVAVGTLLELPPETISKAYEQQFRAQSALNTMAVQGSRTGLVSEGYVAIERLTDFGHEEGNARIVLPELLVRRELGMTPIENVRWTVQLSRSMEPELKRHALLLIDVTVSEHAHVLDGGIYAFTLWDRPEVRRLAIRRGMWSLVGGGQDNAGLELPKSDLLHLKVYGAVVGWL